MSPDFIVADEPVSALDVSIQAQIINLMKQLQEQLGLTYLFIGHDLSVVRHISTRVGVMYLGKLMEMAPRNDLYDKPLHPLHESAPCRSPRAGSRRGGTAGTHRDRRRHPQPAEPAFGLRFPHPLPGCQRRMQDRRPRLIGTSRLTTG